MRFNSRLLSLNRTHDLRVLILNSADGLPFPATVLLPESHPSGLGSQLNSIPALLLDGHVT
jgi:hypothetical protein